jgi:choline/ethanolamine kinase
VKTGHQLVVIDFEYAGYNSRGYDIANHFCEWTYNYHSDNDAVMDMNMYPSVEEQTRFLTSYIHAAKSDMQVKDLMMEVALWRMGPHLFWGLWGLVQANMSEIDYDYFLYSSFRINNFRRDLENAINGTVELV